MTLARDRRIDRSTTVLVLSNIATILFAVVQQWDVSVVMWIYWGQSVIIGYFNVRRMLALKQFSTENFRINNRPAEPTRKTQRQTAFFFAVHYGFFHFAYLVFLFAENSIDSGIASAGVAACVLIFFFNHRYSYGYNRERDAARKPNLGFIMFFPYVRIIPMHTMILAGSHFAGDSTARLVMFLVLKTLADMAMHVIEHSRAGKTGLTGIAERETAQEKRGHSGF